jgi:hypothetical protein
MAVRFTIGHVGGGTKKIDAPSAAIDAVLVELLEELYDSDDEHYQAYVVNSTEAGVTITDSGLMILDANVNGSEAPSRYYRPATRAEAVELLNAFVHLRHEAYAPRFGPEVPPPGPGPNFLLVGMGEFALHRAAWAGNFTRVKYLVEAGHDVNQRTPDGTTPLMGAVSEGHARICRFLVEHGADVTVRWPKGGWDTDDWSLLRLARKEGPTRRFPEIVQILERAGAPE